MPNINETVEDIVFEMNVNHDSIESMRKAGIGYFADRIHYAHKREIEKYQREIQRLHGELKLRCGFSHDYTKLWEQTSAKLLDVQRVDRKDICEDSIEYDTEYLEPELLQKRYYVLTPGSYLRITFIGNKGIPFTTYRTDTPEHREKYEGNIGKVFEIYVKSEEVLKGE